VVALGKLVSFLDDFQVVAGPVGLDAVDQVAETRDRKHVGRDLFPQGRHD